MSLGSTINITVRQKSRFSDDYLGYLPLIPDSFKINPNLVTRSYKLGPKPGKSSSKLRGDIHISFQFLSNWSEQLDRSTEAGMELDRIQSGILKRSATDASNYGPRASNGRVVASEKQSNSSRGRKEILSSLRRSFRRKSKSADSKRTIDDFSMYTSTSMASSSHHFSRSNTLKQGSSVPTTQVSIGRHSSMEALMTSGPSHLNTATQESTVVNHNGSVLTEKFVPGKKPERPVAQTTDAKVVNLFV